MMGYGIEVYSANGDILIDSEKTTLCVLAEKSVSAAYGEIIAADYSPYGAFTLDNAAGEGIWIAKPAGVPGDALGFVTPIGLYPHGAIYDNPNAANYALNDPTRVFPAAYLNQTITFHTIFCINSKDSAAHADTHGIMMYNTAGELTFNGAMPQLRMVGYYTNFTMQNAEYYTLTLPAPLDNPPVVIIHDQSTGAVYSDIFYRHSAVFSGGKYTAVRVSMHVYRDESAVGSPTISIFRY